MRSYAVLLFLFTLTLSVSQVHADDTMKEAWDRIEKHRKSDLQITVSKAGKPVPGADVRIEMKRHEFLFGCNIFMLNNCGTRELDAEYARKFSELFNFATLPFYWWAYEPEKGKPNHAPNEKTAAWCREKNIKTKGHPLAWNFIEAPWMKKTAPGDLFEMQLGRIDNCITHFKADIKCWDVCNEVSAYDREECLRNAPVSSEWMKKIGPVEAARKCFMEAKKADPGAMLLINDYVTDKSYEKTIEGLIDGNGKPLYDVIGIQSHMHSGTWTNERIEEVCGRFSKFGVPLHLTELTVLSGKTGWELRDWKSTPEDEEKQKNEIVRIYTMLFSQPSVEAITWWDFSDRGAWMKAPAGLLREDMSAKPAYDALFDLIQRKWKTDDTIKSDSEGKIKTRVFRGDYEIVVALPEGGSKKFKLTVGGDCEFSADLN